MIQKALPLDFHRTAFRGLFMARRCFFLLAVLVPPLLFGGSAYSSVFILQSLILIGAVLFGLQSMCFGANAIYYEKLKGPLVAFGLFILYIFFQWLGASKVLSAPIPGTIAVFKTRDYFVQLVCYVLFFITSLDLLDSRKKIQTLSLFVAFQAIFLIGLGYYQQYSHPEKLTKLYGVFDMARYGAFFSTFVNPNHYGGFLMIATFLFLAGIAYYVTVNEVFRLDMDLVCTFFYGLLIVLMSFSILHAEARGALFVQIVSVLIFCLVSFYFKRGMHPGLFWGAIALLVGSVVFLGVTRFDFSRLTPQILMKDFMERSGIYKDTLGIVKDFPVFGTGLGSAMYAMSKYQVTAVEEYSWVHLYSHHLELITDTGFLGYLLFMVPLFWLVLSSFKKALRHPSRWRRIYATASFTAIAAVFFLSVMDDYLLTPALAILFLVMVALLVLCANKDIASLDSPVESDLTDASFSAKASFKYGLGILLISVLAFGTVFKDYQALDFYEKADGDLGPLEIAARLRPDDPKIWSEIGEAYYDLALRAHGAEHVRLAKKSVEAHKRAISLTPMFGYYWMLMGRAEILSRDRIRGLQYLVRSAELVPNNRDYALYLIVTALMLAKETPWPEERQPLMDLASFWVKKTFYLKRPLSEEDNGYIRNYGEENYGAISPEIRSDLVNLIRKSRAEAGFLLKK